VTSKHWMRDLPNLKVSHLSIPGTHDSGCNIDCGILQTQTWSIEKQLNHGVRFFDIRCRHVENKFQIYHDVVDCELSFDDLIEIYRIFLSQYPSECLIMRVKEENTSENCSRFFHETFEEYLNKNLDLFYMSNTIPYLNQIRGRIWVLCHFECSHLDAFGWFTANIQDCWDMNNNKISDKVSLIQNHLNAASEEKKDELYINFLSGVGDSAWPVEIAKVTNNVVINYKGRLGAVVFDFPKKDYINHVIRQNLFIDLNNVYSNCILNTNKSSSIMIIAMNIIVKMKFSTMRAIPTLTSSQTKTKVQHKKRKSYKILFIFHIFMILKMNNKEIQNFVNILYPMAQKFIK